MIRHGIGRIVRTELGVERHSAHDVHVFEVDFHVIIVQANLPGRIRDADDVRQAGRPALKVGIVPERHVVRDRRPTGCRQFHEWPIRAQLQPGTRKFSPFGGCDGRPEDKTRQEKVRAVAQAAGQRSGSSQFSSVPATSASRKAANPQSLTIEPSGSTIALA